MVNNRKEFAKQVGDSAVDKRLRELFSRGYRLFEGAVSKESMDQVWKLVVNSAVLSEYSLTLLHKIISMYDKKEYDKMLDFTRKQ